MDRITLKTPCGPFAIRADTLGQMLAALGEVGGAVTLRDVDDATARAVVDGALRPFGLAWRCVVEPGPAPGLVAVTRIAGDVRRPAAPLPSPPFPRKGRRAARGSHVYGWDDCPVGEVREARGASAQAVHNSYRQWCVRRDLDPRGVLRTTRQPDGTLRYWLAAAPKAIIR